jgi:hypothetical protein
MHTDPRKWLVVLRALPAAGDGNRYAEGAGSSNPVR